MFAVAAVRRLGVQWSIVARVTESHELITSGPYAIVRHPIYAAMLGLLIATGLTFGTLVSTLAGAVLYIVGTWLRTRSEERLLESAFGARYDAYRRKVPALIPGFASADRRGLLDREPHTAPRAVFPLRGFDHEQVIAAGQLRERQADAVVGAASAGELVGSQAGGVVGDRLVAGIGDAAR